MSENGSVAVRLLAVNVGHVTVTVKVTSLRSAKEIFTDSVTIQVR
jgi:hypothetical protein